MVTPLSVDQADYAPHCHLAISPAQQYTADDIQSFVRLLVCPACQVSDTASTGGRPWQLNSPVAPSRSSSPTSRAVLAYSSNSVRRMPKFELTITACCDRPL